MLKRISRRDPVGSRFSAGAFTLIELILVMALLIIVIGLITPKIRDFFNGRTLFSESRRFLALVHYAQSRAVSEGIPTVLWVDSKKGTYGLELESGYADTDRKAVTYSVDSGLKIDVAKGTLTSGKSTVSQPKRGSMPGIHFSPDGMVIASTSVPAVAIQGNRDVLWIAATPNYLTYEIQPLNVKNTYMRR